MNAEPLQQREALVNSVCVLLSHLIGGGGSEEIMKELAARQLGL